MDDVHFDSSLRERWVETQAGWRFEMPDGWMQGRSVFGGLTAAAATALARRHVDAARWLRTLNVQFLGPVVTGCVRATFREVCERKNVTFAEIRLAQRQGEVAVVNFVFTVPRSESTSIESAACWTGPNPESLVEVPYLPGLTPEFTRHVELRWADGGLPFSGAHEARTRGYCRFRKPGGDVEGLVGLLDVWPIPSLSVLAAPAPASSVTWTAHVLRAPRPSNDWFAFEYETAVGERGFHTVVGRLHGPDGRLVAWTEQLVAVFG